MVLVWNKPEQSILEQVPIVTNLPLLGGFKMVADNSMIDPMIQATLEEADSLMVGLKQLKTKDDLIMAKKEENIQVVRLISRNFVYFKPFLLQLPPRGGGKGKGDGHGVLPGATAMEG